MNAQKSQPPAAQQSATAGRKPWVKKSITEVFMDQVAKQRGRVQELRQDLAREEHQLQKLEEACKVLETE